MKTFVIIWVGLTLLFFMLVGLWVVARLTNALQYYSAPSPSNAPAIRVGDNYFGSKLVAPQRRDFITYYVTSSDGERAIFVFRLCGMAGDTVVIRRGRLLVNGQDADAGLSLAQHYAMKTRDYYTLEKTAVSDTSAVEFRGDSVYQVALTEAAARRTHGRARRQLQPPDEPNPIIAQQYNASWNRDHFGPYIVPAGRYFVLGDNRNNAYDSRYAGCLKTSDYVTTVLGK